jgi:hypothetical protein
MKTRCLPTNRQVRSSEAPAPVPTGGAQMQIRLATLDLGGCGEFAECMTADSQRFIAGLRGVGGPINVATITREGLRWVRRKEPTSDAEPRWLEVSDSKPAPTATPPDGVRRAGRVPYDQPTASVARPQVTRAVAALWHPWIRIERLTRIAVAARLGEPGAEAVSALAAVLAQRGRVERAGWFD